MPAGLVLAAAQPWSPQTHERLPTAARVHVVGMLMLGHRLLRELRYKTVAQAMFDLWMDGVIPHAVEREVGA